MSQTLSLTLQMICSYTDLLLIYRDDQILLNGLLFYVGHMILPQAHNLPLWRRDGVVISSLLHAGPVEFLYYWIHRTLHHHYLYSRYHSHHHSSIVSEPITCKILHFIIYIYIHYLRIIYIEKLKAKSLT
jgi:sterol desaturase/sphingolipid hydroxylase (fatty acid hydroxylase superfamily)